MSEKSELDEDIKPKQNMCDISFICKSDSDKCALFSDSGAFGICKYLCNSFKCCTSKVAQAQVMRAKFKEMGL